MAESDYDETALVPAPPTLPAVKSAPETAVDRLRRRYEQLQDKDLAVTTAMNRFSDLPSALEDPTDAKVQLLLSGPEDDVKRAGWKSKKELRMAAYARLPKKLWPAAMQAAHERVGMRIRKQSANAAKLQFNLNMVTIPAPRRDPEARVVIVEPLDPRDK